jgi:hypothetical protein
MKLDAILRHIDTVGDPFASVGLSREASDAEVDRALAAARETTPGNPAIGVLADPEVRARFRLLLPAPAAEPSSVKEGLQRELGYVGPGSWRATVRALSARRHEDSTCNR